MSLVQRGEEFPGKTFPKNKNCAWTVDRNKLDALEVLKVFQNSRPDIHSSNPVLWGQYHFGQPGEEYEMGKAFVKAFWKQN